MTDTSAQFLGRYTIHAELGRGGFATVYRATDTTLERDVALKILKPGWTDDAKAVERFMREAKQASRLKHANIVTIYDVGQAEGRLFIAMELVPGRSLQQIVAEDGAMAWSRVLAILEQSATALGYAHRQGLIHRDIKPANIILDESEPAPAVHVMLTDFGLVRGAEQASLSMGSTGGLLGTPEYIAPEIWDGEPATKASDIYAMGCVAYFLLTGKILFGATTPVAVLKRHVEGPIFPQQWPSGVPAGADAVLRRALSKDPNQRPASATELAADLRSCEGQAAKEQEAQQQEASQKKEAERAAQTLLAAQFTRHVAEERARQEAERTAQEEADRKSREEQERQRQANLAAQTAAAEKAKQEADRKAREAQEAQERQRQANLAAQSAAAEKAKQEADRKAREAQEAQERQRQANLAAQSAAAEKAKGAEVVDRKRFLWLSVVGGAIGWGLGWSTLFGLANELGLLSLVLAGVFVGLIFSSAQWLALRHRASAWKWIVASMVGLGVGFGLGLFTSLNVLDISSPADGMVIIGGMTGLGIGLAQWLVLRPHMSGVLWWLAANAGVLAMGLSIAARLVESSVSYGSFGAVLLLTLGCVLHSAASGWLLPRSLKPLP